MSRKEVLISIFLYKQKYTDSIPSEIKFLSFIYYHINSLLK